VGADACRISRIDGAQATSLATIVLHGAAGLVKERIGAFRGRQPLLETSAPWFGRSLPLAAQRESAHATSGSPPSCAAVRSRRLAAARWSRTLSGRASWRHARVHRARNVDRHMDEVVATHRRLALRTV
jgi:hypothetical protein